MERVQHTFRHFSRSIGFRTAYHPPAGSLHRDHLFGRCHRGRILSAGPHSDHFHPYHRLFHYPRRRSIHKQRIAVYLSDCLRPDVPCGTRQVCARSTDRSQPDRPENRTPLTPLPETTKAAGYNKSPHSSHFLKPAYTICDSAYYRKGLPYSGTKNDSFRTVGTILLHRSK